MKTAPTAVADRPQDATRRTPQPDGAVPAPHIRPPAVQPGGSAKPAGVRVRDVLDKTVPFLKAKGFDSARLDTEVLLAHVLGVPRIQLYVRYDEVLPPARAEAMRGLVRRRAAAEPVAHLVGHREFFSHRFRVTADTLVPRPSTETLVVESLALLKEADAPRVLDLCTGTGCVAVSIAKGHDGATVLATDLSEQALDVAESNVADHDLIDRVTPAAGDLFAAVPAGERFDLIAANPPYVRDDEWDALPADVRDHEPKSALLAGTDGLDLVRRIVADAGDFLNDGGSLLLEVAGPQCPTVEGLLTDAGFTAVRTVPDGDGIPRVVIGRRP